VPAEGPAEDPGDGDDPRDAAESDAE
jgi:hypothetical protein